MIALAALTLAATAPSGTAASADEALSVAVAMGCVLHATDVSPIVASRRKEVAAAGLLFVPTPPKDVQDRVAQSVPAAWGRAGYASITWPGGHAWVVGFAGHDCLIEATGTDGAALDASVRAQFETPGVPWQRLPAADAPLRYGMAVTPPGGTAINLVANVAVVPGAGIDIITIQVAR